MDVVSLTRQDLCVYSIRMDMPQQQDITHVEAVTKLMGKMIDHIEVVVSI